MRQIKIPDILLNSYVNGGSRIKQDALLSVGRRAEPLSSIITIEFYIKGLIELNDKNT